MEPYYNSSYGPGFSGMINYSNTYVNYSLIPLFLFVVWGVVFYVLKKFNLKNGAIIAYDSLGCFLLSLIAKTMTQFNDLFLFVFGLGVGIGLVISYFER